MLKTSVWAKLKKTLIKLPASDRIRELKVILVSTTNKPILKEANELLEKAKIEAAELPWREKFNNFGIRSRLNFPTPEEGAARPKSPELEEIVSDIPTEKKINAPADYSKQESYIKDGYFNQTYDPSSNDAQKLMNDSDDSKTSQKDDDFRNRRYTQP